MIMDARKAIQKMAEVLAASIPPHLGQPTTPPISWAQNGDTVTVILADGRKVSASIEAINALMFAPAPVPVRGNTPAKVDLDAIDAVDLLKPPASKTPAKKTKPAASGGKGKR